MAFFSRVPIQSVDRLGGQWEPLSLDLEEVEVGRLPPAHEVFGESVADLCHPPLHGWEQGVYYLHFKDWNILKLVSVPQISVQVLALRLRAGRPPPQAPDLIH